MHQHHDKKACEDTGWVAQESDDVTFHNSQDHPITVHQAGSHKWPFKPNGPYVIDALKTKDCQIVPGLPADTYHYELDGCPPSKGAPKTVIIS